MHKQVKSAAQASASALEEIFRRFSVDLHRYVQRRLRQPADAEDLTQEIFERFMRADWRTRARNPHAYLFGIASNVVADARMAAQQTRVAYDSDASDKAAEQLISEAQDPQDIALGEEILRLLNQLSDVHRTALLLTKRDGLSGAEAAARMGTTPASVRVYVCEARARLKVLLKQGGR